jgi:mRNA-degrading endonuclease toxin of MazEF toxin-antitoxin module
MALPDPVAGMVIRYSYLWSEDRRQGRDEGLKDRPCVVVLAVTREQDQIVVTVAPITHRPPQSDSGAIEIPANQKRRLGLDDEQSWIVTDELNKFDWPSPDLRPVDARKPRRFS